MFFNAKIIQENRLKHHHRHTKKLRLRAVIYLARVIFRIAIERNNNNNKTKTNKKEKDPPPLQPPEKNGPWSTAKSAMLSSTSPKKCTNDSSVAASAKKLQPFAVHQPVRNTSDASVTAY